MNFGLDKNSRSITIAWAFIIVFSLIIIRLFYLQVIEHNHYSELANKEQVKSLKIPAKRGRVYAMNRNEPVPFVMNQQVYNLFVDPTVVNKPDRVEEVINKNAKDNVIVDNLSNKIRDKSTQYNILAKNVTLTQAKAIKAEKLKGIGFQKVSKRVYPEGSLAAQTLGFVNNDDNGQYGVEEYLNDRLKGKDGLLKTVTDIADVPLSIGKDNIRKDAVDGDDIVLTIDRNIQAKTEEFLAKGLERSGAEKASAIVMDPNNGHILAMANLPSYNPAEYTSVQDAAQFVNATVMVPYEPGSVMKTFTVATGINQGVISPDTTFYNTDYTRVGDITISNATKGVTGNITIQTALNNSLNTGMVQVARLLGGGSINNQSRNVMYDYLHKRFGLGDKTGIEVSFEQPGTIIAPDKAEGNAVRYSNMSFGQGMNATMVQVAAGFSAIINGGNYFKPTVIEGQMKDGKLIKNEPAEPKNNVIKSDTSATTKEMIHKARNFYTKNDKPGFYVGGKTGTSQTIGDDGKYTSKQTVGSYLGYGGTREKSKYVIMVQVSGKGMYLEGFTDAMPIFTDISNWLLDYFNLQPNK